MKKIHLKNTGKYAIVDDEDYYKIVSFGKWHENDSGYAVKRGIVHGKSSTIRMHRVITNPPKYMEVDHINGNRLDNRKENLRVVSHAINAWNTIQNRSKKKPDLPTGIAWDNTRKKYIATKITRKRFDNLDDALAYKNSSELYEHEHRRLHPQLPTGVSILKGSSRYNAKFVHNKVKYYLGTFATPEEGVEAIKNKKKELGIWQE